MFFVSLLTFFLSLRVNLQLLVKRLFLDNQFFVPVKVSLCRLRFSHSLAYMISGHHSCFSIRFSGCSDSGIFSLLMRGVGVVMFAQRGMSNY